MRPEIADLEALAKKVEELERSVQESESPDPTAVAAQRVAQKRRVLGKFHLDTQLTQSEHLPAPIRPPRPLLLP